MTVLDRFLKYVTFDTQSNEETGTTPSTQGQRVFAEALVKELEAIGMEEISLDENSYVMATLPANTDEKIPTIGFIAHLDTSPDMSGKNVQPRIVTYLGGDIVLDAEENVVLSQSMFPELSDYIGQGADHFDVEKFGCDWGYTIDGGQIGELEYENFNAAGAKIIFKGLNVHPGYAKDKMQNASLRAIEFASWLPAEQRPEHTTGYEGFFHLTGMTGSVEEATLSYIIRDHDRKLFEEKKELLRMLVDKMNEAHPGCAHLELRDQYYNMREVVEPQKHIVDLAFEAMTSVGVEPIVKPIRGGTDGARLSFMGLPCPNIFAGGLNFHGRYEFLPVRSLEKSMETVIKIIELSARKS